VEFNPNVNYAVMNQSAQDVAPVSLIPPLTKQERYNIGKQRKGRAWHGSHIPHLFPLLRPLAVLYLQPA